MKFSNVKKFMDSLTDWIIPGNSVVIYQDNEKVFEYSSGYSDKENKIKMNGNEYLNIYSCSKPATVTAALTLIEKGKLSLTDPLSYYIPEFKDMYIKREDGVVKKAENQITIHNLFTMTAGFSYNTATATFDEARKFTQGKMDTLTVIKCLSKDTLFFEPGEMWNYSLCHDVLAAVVEIVSGVKFSRYVEENIFRPLDMNKSFFHTTPEILSNMAEQYECKTDETDYVKLQICGTAEGGVVENIGKSNSLVFGGEYDSGGAGIVTTVPDYAKFAAALARGGLGINGNRILKPESVDMLKQNQLTEEQLKCIKWKQLKGYGYGLGVRTMMNVAESGFEGNFGEFGWGGAAGATILCDTELKIGMFYAHHMRNPQEDYYQPRLRDALYKDIYENR